MKIIVLVKQVPETSEVEIDPVKGTLKREGVLSKTNPYDLHALEAALRLKDEVGGEVTVLSMGPPQAEAVIREAYSMGADSGVLLSDRAFAGADTLATSFTLSRAIQKIGFDLVIAGMQSTDGDTAQVGPGVAEILDIPHVSYVREIQKATPEALTVTCDHGDYFLTVEVRLPCLLTVSRDINQPRLPSYRKKKLTKDKPVQVWGRKDLTSYDSAEEYFGLDGSPTRVERIFAPERKRVREIWEGTPGDLAGRLYHFLKEAREI
ncbi:MAG TPA: electron transfer flavoprotein subunit beta/FixA family protein [Firmicutes bacterium]|nr:electron transfer flavoprotein subunit beta/FixA family protein [Candidatus Fermentithermobacillaceae bacterium]